MTQPHRSPLPERADPAALLIDAVINQQSNLAQRLGRQWVHRRGVVDFGVFLDGRLRSTCGHDGVRWLRDQLELSETSFPQSQPSGQPGTASEIQAPATVLPSPASVLPSSAAVLPSSAAVLASRSRLGPLTPAPAPPSLAPLRAWLSDAA